MDVVSLSASLVTLLSAVLGLSKGLHSLIRSIKNAPDDLTILSNELQDLLVVLSSVELSVKCMDEFQESSQLLTVLPTILRRMEDKLRQLEHHIQGFCDLQSGSTV